MFNNILLKTGAIIIASTFVSASALAAGMNKTQYSASKSSISAEYKVSKAACDPLSDFAKDVCIERAKGKEKVARAELEYRYSGKTKDAKKIPIVKADTTYSLAKELCNDKSDNTKDICIAEAKANHVKAISAAKMMKDVNEASVERSEELHAADYKLAKEKCDAFSGETQTKCVNDAKKQYDQ